MKRHIPWIAALMLLLAVPRPARAQVVVVRPWAYHPWVYRPWAVAPVVPVYRPYGYGYGYGYGPRVYRPWAYGVRRRW